VTLPGEAVLFDSFTPQHGFGLDSVLRENRSHLYGILHGVDYSKTNPPLDTLIGKDHKSDDKLGCRQVLLDRLGLERTTGGTVLYLPIEPGDVEAFGSVKPVLDLILTADSCLVVTGKAPDQDLADVIIAERKYPTRFAYRPEPDEKLRPLILAGADAILLPSSLGFRGTNVLAAMRYGTLPIVKAYGGIHQLLSDYDPASEEGCGFMYNNHSSMALWDSVRRANHIFRHSEEWKKLAQRARAIDFSWSESAKAFAKLYANLLRHQVATAA
jgi:starch synthase